MKRTETIGENGQVIAWSNDPETYVDHKGRDRSDRTASMGFSCDTTRWPNGRRRMFLWRRGNEWLVRMHDQNQRETYYRSSNGFRVWKRYDDDGKFYDPETTPSNWHVPTRQWDNTGMTVTLTEYDVETGIGAYTSDEGAVSRFGEDPFKKDGECDES